MKEKPREMMGFETAADQRVQISMRDWDAVRRALWRSRIGWEAAMRSASEIIQRCRHLDGCPGALSDTEPCLGGISSLNSAAAQAGVPLAPGCPDRETRMDALVILNAARTCAPVDARHPANQPYIAPSREYYSEILATFVIMQAQLEALRAAGVEIPEPPSKGGTLVLPSTKLPQLQPKETPNEARPDDARTAPETDPR